MRPLSESGLKRVAMMSSSTTRFCSILLLQSVNSFLSTHQLTRRIRREVKKNLQKFVALPFALKFEIKPGKEIAQFPSKFEKRHLNVAYMTAFFGNPCGEKQNG